MTYNKNLSQQQYKESQILNASPVERIVLCYDGAIKALMHAKAAIAEKKIETRCNQVQKAHDIVCYLQETLDHEKGGEISGHLSRYYSYLLHRMVEINLHNSIEIADEIIDLLKTMRLSWVKIAEDQQLGTSDAKSAIKDEEPAPMAVNSSV